MASQGIKVFAAIVVVVILATIIVFLIYERVVREPVRGAPFPPAESVMPPQGSGNIQNAPSATVTPASS